MASNTIWEIHHGMAGTNYSNGTANQHNQFYHKTHTHSMDNNHNNMEAKKSTSTCPNNEPQQLLPTANNSNTDSIQGQPR